MWYFPEVYGTMLGVAGALWAGASVYIVHCEEDKAFGLVQVLVGLALWVILFDCMAHTMGLGDRFVDPFRVSFGVAGLVLLCVDWRGLIRKPKTAKNGL